MSRAWVMTESVKHEADGSGRVIAPTGLDRRSLLKWLAASCAVAVAPVVATKEPRVKIISMGPTTVTLPSRPMVMWLTNSTGAAVTVRGREVLPGQTVRLT